MSATTRWRTALSFVCPLLLLTSAAAFSSSHSFFSARAVFKQLKVENPSAICETQATAFARSCFRQRGRPMGTIVFAQPDANQAGEAVPTRKQKQVPKHVESLLQEQTVVNDVLENVPNADDFQGLGTSSVKQQMQIKTELYVRGIPWDMEADGLKALFIKYQPKYARALKDKDGQKSLGFGFVRFTTEAKAQEAMKAMDGMELPRKDGGKTRLSVSIALAKSKSRPMASKTLKVEINKKIQQRKRELSDRDTGNVVESFEDMPRRFKALADRESAAEAEERARRLVEMFEDAGNKIEDVSMKQLARERAEEKNVEVRDMMWGDVSDDEGDDDDDGDDGDENWAFVPDGEDDADETVDSEQERKDWEDYKKKNKK